MTMTPAEVLEEMSERINSGAWPGIGTVKIWADALEKAMREPMAEVDGLGFVIETGLIGDMEPGTKLYTIPPNAGGGINEQQREIEKLQALVDTLRQQAQIHAQEARTANASLHECYQAVTHGKGEPGNWNGANPVVAEIEKLRTKLTECDGKGTL